MPLIKKTASTGKPLIISTGMATLGELDQAVNTARDAGCEQLVLLKCTSTYPATPDNTNISTIPRGTIAAPTWPAWTCRNAATNRGATPKTARGGAAGYARRAWRATSALAAPAAKSAPRQVRIAPFWRWACSP